MVYEDFYSTQSKLEAQLHIVALVYTSDTSVAVVINKSLPSD